MPDDCSGPDTHASARVILIVEDEEDIGTFLVQAISLETFYHPIWVSDAFAALKQLHELKPDLLILDYQLPHMNGLELYDHIRAIKGFEAIPVILMTAFQGMPWNHFEKRKIIGIAKPFELSEVLTTIDTLLAEGSGVQP